MEPSNYVLVIFLEGLEHYRGVLEVIFFLIFKLRT